MTEWDAELTELRQRRELAEASRPLYPVYAGLSHRAFGLSALGDQQLAAGIMWVPGSLAYTVAFVLSVWVWNSPSNCCFPTKII